MEGQNSNQNHKHHLSIWAVLKSLKYREELVYGSFAGFTIILFGHPFDTIKTYTQIHMIPAHFSIRLIYKTGGLINFYKGMFYPAITTTLLNASVFTAYELFKKVSEHFLKKPTTDYSVIALAGFGTGLVNSLITSPIELLKIQKQIQVDGKSSVSYWTILENMNKMSGRFGILQGLYLTFFRDSFGYMFQFLAYCATLDYLASWDKEKTTQKYHYLIAGANAGFWCWMSTYPVDTVKSKYQCKLPDKRLGILPNGQFLEISKEILASNGLRGFYAGLMASLGRAIVANALGFYAWNLSREYIKL